MYILYILLKLKLVNQNWFNGLNEIDFKSEWRTIAKADWFLAAWI